ncbi:four-helix bundle copper-binding protein [Candidatus Parabeggiatoa sp. HSG14]|uniref:four-helix bundle copper-binding protein n=1 Tax=Candidatus Parabeggiatoa sp. HSG14 TaxID=3055593 RepID=UPI0025A6E049|nr:four-helix bundle copper-binding protein [Thiotrichales bacterium HSG14]
MFTKEKHIEEQTSKTIESLDRRKLLIGAGAAISLASATSTVWGANNVHQGHAGHTMMSNQGIVDTSLDCVKKSQACLAHCFELFKSGDTSLAECADIVQDMQTMCNAISGLAASQSRHLKALAQVCIEMGKDCEKECRKHEEKHTACKACADACVNCIEECKKIV